MVWVKCTTSAECKTIRIAESSVMDLEWPYLTCVEFWFYKMISEKWNLYRTGYLEGTAVAREWFGVLERYCRDDGEWSCMIDHGCLGQT
jgi:hypothetical protein